MTFNFISSLGYYVTPQVYAFQGEREPKEKHEEKEYQVREKMDEEGRGYKCWNHCPNNIILQTHACDLKGNLQPVLRSCCMQRTPPKQVHDRNPSPRAEENV